MNEHEQAFDSHFGQKKDYSRTFMTIMLAIICMLLLVYIINMNDECKAQHDIYCNAKCPLCIQPAHGYYDPQTGAYHRPNETIEENYSFPLVNTTKK